MQEIKFNQEPTACEDNNNNTLIYSPIEDLQELRRSQLQSWLVRASLLQKEQKSQKNVNYLPLHNDSRWFFIKK
jgi:hypothetical protein